MNDRPVACLALLQHGLKRKTAQHGDGERAEDKTVHPHRARRRRPRSSSSSSSGHGGTRIKSVKAKTRQSRRQHAARIDVHRRVSGKQEGQREEQASRCNDGDTQTDGRMCDSSAVLREKRGRKQRQNEKVKGRRVKNKDLEASDRSRETRRAEYELKAK